MTAAQWLTALLVGAAVLAALALGRPEGPASDEAAAGEPAADDPDAGSAAADDLDDPAAGDGGAEADPPPAAEPTEEPPSGPPYDFPDPPDAPEGPVDPALLALVEDHATHPLRSDPLAIAAIGAGGDVRLLWALSDIIRLAPDPQTYEAATDAATELSGLPLRDLAPFSWGPLTDHLIAWDVPAFDGYVDFKRAVFTVLEPAWAPFFDDEGSAIDWRLVSWGGVLIDDRPLGSAERCIRGCIPSLDDPGLVPADEGGWYPDDGIVFGVRIADEAVALPRNIMEVHEMVNTTIGGRQVAIPYCTLCGAAQVFFTDEEGGGTGEMVMRTSGLLHRSNKVMYDLTTQSVFDTFTGAAVSGPLHDAGVRLDQATVVTTTWAQWRDANPDTAIIAEDGGIGRRYQSDPLAGRDDGGPIFPIGDRDERLGVHDQVVGIVLGDGTPIAFDVADARAALDDGEDVELAGVTIRPEAGGLVAEVDGEPFPSHQAFWFAWSQFHPTTLLWPQDVGT